MVHPMLSRMPAPPDIGGRSSSFSHMEDEDIPLCAAWCAAAGGGRRGVKLSSACSGSLENPPGWTLLSNDEYLNYYNLKHVTQL